MYKVFIVDDEEFIAQGLGKIVDWGLMDCQTYIYTDSITAYEAAVSENPHILITDIKMPDMDGIELISRLKAASLKTEAIILSGFSEFEFARKGIELGVNKYILKPIEKEDLKAAVEQLLTKFKEQNLIQDELEHYKKRHETGIFMMRDVIFQDIVSSGQYSAGEIIDIASGLDVDFTDSYTLCAVLEIFNYSAYKSAESSATISELVREVYGDMDIRSTPFHYFEDKYTLIMNSTAPMDMAVVRERSEVFADRLKKAVNTDLAMSLGEIKQNISGISESFREALIALNNKIIQHGENVFLYGDIEAEIQYIAIPSEIFAQLEEEINRDNPDAVGDIIDTIFGILLSHSGITPQEIQIQCLNILLVCTKNLSFIQLQLHKALGKDMLSLHELSRFKTPEELKNLIKSIIKSIVEIKITQSHSAERNDTIDSIKTYIDAHFTENISLPLLSELFFMNPYYLSQLFKKKTGHTYISYLTNKRIEKAKKLLAEQKLKNYEVCHLVGYEDVKHFSRIFERIVGVKPSAYKRL